MCLLVGFFFTGGDKSIFINYANELGMVRGRRTSFHKHEGSQWELGRSSGSLGMVLLYLDLITNIHFYFIK